MKKEKKILKKKDKRSWFGKKKSQDKQEKDERLKELRDDKDVHKIDWDLEKEKDVRLQELENERNKKEIKFLIKKRLVK